MGWDGRRQPYLYPAHHGRWCAPAYQIGICFVTLNSLHSLVSLRTEVCIILNAQRVGTGTLINSHTPLRVHWPDTADVPLPDSISTLDVSDFSIEQAAGSFFKLEATNSSTTNTTSRVDEYEGTICLMESHDSEPIVGHQLVQLGCVNSSRREQYLVRQ